MTIDKNGMPEEMKNVFVIFGGYLASLCPASLAFASDILRQGFKCTNMFCKGLNIGVSL
jgi:hypothetical protein